jgi:thymidylate synthase
MKLFVGRDFSELYYEMLEVALSENVSLIDSRVGPVKDFGCAYYELHAEDSRLTYLIGRNLNPFFALAEFAWIINGSNALKPLQFFIKSYGQYSDDGETLNGAYGFRLRHYFGRDQIEATIQLLRNDSSSRRVVLTLWSATDLAANSKDLPCNTAIYLKIRNEALDITVFTLECHTTF